MNSLTRLLIVLGALPLLILMGACGGSGDDSDEDEDGGPSAEASQAGAGDSSSSAGSGSPASGPTTSSKSGERKTVRDGTLDGAIKIEISGDKKAKIELEGSGVVLNGLAMLNFGDTETFVMLTIGPEKDEPGGILVTTKELSTAGDWGKSCDIRYEDGETELKGEFACKGIAAVALGTAKTYKITVAGSFALKRK